MSKAIGISCAFLVVFLSFAPLPVHSQENNINVLEKQFQELYLNSRFEASGKGVTNPNFRKISKAYGISYNRIISHKNLKNTLRKVLKSNKAEFVEVMLKPDQKIIPKLQFGNPIEDLSPLLPRNEFYNNMFVPLVDRSKKIFEAN